LKGTYLLLLRLDSDLANLPVGRLGHFRFAAGYYLYVGSARGPGGIAARLSYHERPVKQHPHWHIDYLRPHVTLVEAWAAVCPARLECPWLRALAGTDGFSFPVPRFGASDNGCPSHLLYAQRRPGLRLLTEALLAALAGERAQELTLEIWNYEGGGGGKMTR
jgi:Uri superfamily endonuclease